MSVLKKGIIFNLLGSYINIIFSIISGLIFVPIYLKYFSLEVYGAWLATGNILNIIGLLEGGVNAVYTQQLSQKYAAKDLVGYAKITTAGLLLSIVASCLIMLIGFVASPFIGDIFNINASNTTSINQAFIIGVIGIGISIFGSAFISITRSWHSNKYAITANTLSASIGLISIYITLVYFNAGIISIAIGNTVRALINMLLLGRFTLKTWYILNLPKLKYDKSITKQFFIKTTPLFLGKIGTSILKNSKELLIAVLVGPGYTAVVNITGRLYTVLLSVINPMTASLYAAMSTISNDKGNYAIKFNDISKIFNYLLIILFVNAMLVNQTFVGLWVGEDKYGGHLLSVILFIGSLFVAKFNFNTMILNSRESFQSTAFGSIIELITRFGLIFLLSYTLTDKILLVPMSEAVSGLISIVVLELYMRKLQIRDKGNLTDEIKFYFIMFILTSLISFLLLGNILNEGYENISFMILFNIVYATFIIKNKNMPEKIRGFVRVKF